MRRLLRPLTLLGVAGAMVWAYRAFGLSERMTIAGMRALVDAHAPYGPLAFMAVCIAGIFLHLPAIVFIAMGGVVFGGVRAFAYGWIASLVGATATFVLVRYVARARFQRMLDGPLARLRALDDRLERHGFRTVFVLRLFLILAPPLNWALGATRVRTPDYVAGTALGVVPGIATAVFFADAIANRPAGSGGFPPAVVAAAAAAALVVVATAVARRRLGRGAPRT
jgi:uncharacterized membrane protein YdjX (TVP38/TMEM64 family)